MFSFLLCFFKPIKFNKYLYFRFHPPCPSRLIKTKFVPILDPDENDQFMLEGPDHGTSRWLGHTIRDSRYCWCDSDALAACANGTVPRFFVIEVSIASTNATEALQRTIFANEHKKVYIRRNGYVERVKGAEIEMLKSMSYRSSNVPLFDVSSDEFFSYDEDDNDD